MPDDQFIVEGLENRRQAQCSSLSSVFGGILLLFRETSIAGIERVVVTIPGWHIELPQSIMARVLGNTVTTGADDDAPADFDGHSTDLAACFRFNTSTAFATFD